MAKSKNKKNNKTNDLDKIHSNAMKQYGESFAAERNQRELCIDDMRFAFVPGEQWNDVANQQRSNRPRFEVNKIAPMVNQVIGDQRQNRIKIKVRASKGEASNDTAKVLGGLIRNIEDTSNFKDIKDTAFKEIVSGGMGGWYVTTGYEDDSSDQELKIKPIHSAATSIYYDPSSTDELKRDAKWIMVTTDVDRDWFKAKYPDATTSSLSTISSNSYLSDWQARDTIRIADYWMKVPVNIELAQMSNGSVIELNDKTKTIIDDLALQDIKILNTRKKMSHKVVMYKVTASEIIEGPFEWAGLEIPVIPIFGYNTWINGQHYYQGIVRPAKDPQRVYNYATSQAIETSALSPKDPFWITPAQASGHETQLKNFNNTNNPFMMYNPDPENPGTPKRGGSPSVQQALILQIQQADTDIQSSTGLYNPSLGQQSGQDQSGRAILALQRQGNVATNELSDNLVKAVEYTGKILIGLIPKIYDTTRQINILEEDGTTETATLNNTVIDAQTGENVIINDVSKGKYDVVSKSGPSFATQKSEGLNLLVKLAEGNELFSQVTSDLIAKSVDFDFSDELSDRVRKVMIGQGLVEPNEEEAAIMQEQNAQQNAPSAFDQLEFEKFKLGVEQSAAIVDQLELQNEKIKADIEYKRVDTAYQAANTQNKISDTQNNLTNDILTKTEINSNLDEQGKVIDIPIEQEELAARSKNLRILNESLEPTRADYDRMVFVQPVENVELPPMEE